MRERDQKKKGSRKERESEKEQELGGGGPVKSTGSLPTSPDFNSIVLFPAIYSPWTKKKKGGVY